MSDPIPMILTCPSCGARHIDEGDFATKPHHTHACQSCGMVWRPAKIETVGVAFLPGYRNSEPERSRLVSVIEESDPDRFAIGMARTFRDAADRLAHSRRFDHDPTTTSIDRIAKQRDEAVAAHSAALVEIRESRRQLALLLETVDILENAIERRDREAVEDPSETETLRRERDEARNLRIAAEDAARAMRVCLDANTRRSNALQQLLIAVGEWRGQLDERGLAIPQNATLSTAYVVCSTELTSINCEPINCEPTRIGDDEIPF